MTTLVELIAQVHRALRPVATHAFGGALALAYIADPRGTVDIDVNVFVSPERLQPIFGALADLGFTPQDADPMPGAGLRLTHESDPFPIDLFPSLDDRYAEIESRTELHPFGDDGELLPFLSAEDLCVFKLSFGRPKDWVDLAAIIDARPSIDLEVIEELVVHLRGPMMLPRVARLRALGRRT